METIDHIEKVIKRRRELVGAIQTGQQAINDVDRKETAWVTAPGNSAFIRIPGETMLPIMEKQLELLEFELAAIDKQLDAIGALMGAKA